ncbi:MAG: hypothetical protein CMH57_13795 [Myxococcales bacterium]|nr:hypothetical protein [Myxococcales bacterium]
MDRIFSAPLRIQLLISLLLCAMSPAASAQDPSPPEDPSEPLEGEDEEEDDKEEGEDGEEDEDEGDEETELIEGEEDYSVDVIGERLTNPGRAKTRVERKDIEIRLPRSAPDALRYEPGVYVQQTAQSQASPYIRGRTGQQTVLLFDEVRLNNSLFRSGPNQYFFTIDSRTIDHIDVMRGSASTRYASDAIAGVINAVPIEPTMDPKEDGLRLTSRGMFRYATADNETGGRVQLDAQYGPRLGFIGGFGYRSIGRLESGGIVYSPRDGSIPEVPRFEDDDRTQLGTGFDEITSDGRFVYRLTPKQRLVLAAYDYRQRDAPRTDKCPPPEAPFNECLKYDEQDRTVVYARAEGDFGEWAKWGRLTLSFQRQHERRTSERPLSFTINGGRDDVNTFGVALQSETRRFKLAPSVEGLLRYGADGYHDRVSSQAWLIFTDLDITRIRSRGQYIEGSTYSWGGAFSEGELLLWEQLVLRAGGRASVIRAQADQDVESGTERVDRTWSALVGNAGVEWWATDWMTLLGNVDQGYRAPNLDDLTSRQQTGPGFQFENANLEPERSMTLESGVQLFSRYLELDAWVYRSTLDQAIARAQRRAEECPPNTTACNSSRSLFQLVNLDGQAVIWGAEGGAKLVLPHGFSLRATVSYAWGDGPNPGDRPDDPNLNFEERVPLSRIPPLNGTVEGLWRSAYGYYVGFGYRWATLQDRLAISDESDARIPFGGTPGFSVFDVRAGYRYDPYFLVSAVFENVTDEAYRYHGSSVNGPARGLILNLEVGY